MAVSDVELLRITQIYGSCMVAIAYWDWLVCLGREWRVIWKGEWSLVKVLYIFTRYWSLPTMAVSLWAFTDIFEFSYCHNFVHVVTAINGVTVLACQMILAIRTYAIWGRPRWLLFIIGCCIALEIAAKTAGTVAVKPIFPPGLPGPCIPTTSNPSNYLYFLSPVIIDAILTSLCFYKAFQIARAGKATSILKIFVRDGLLYFTVVSVTNLVQTGFLIQPRSAMKAINAPAAISLSSMMCCRLVLSLKSKNTKQPESVNSRYLVGSGTGHTAIELPSRGINKSHTTLRVPTSIDQVKVKEQDDLEKASSTRKESLTGSFVERDF